MSHRDAFSAEEWSEITLAPMIAGFAVTSADPSGLIGLARESSATAWSLRAAREMDGTLAAEVASAYETPECRQAASHALREIAKGRTPEGATDEAIARLAAMARTLDARSPAAAIAFKCWLSATAATVAEAAMEGTVLGFGGVRVSETERRALNRIDAALGLPDAAAPDRPVD